MNEKVAKDVFHSIDEFMKLQHSPSASLIDGFPVIAKYLPRALQWYRPEAGRIFNETVGSVNAALKPRLIDATC